MKMKNENEQKETSFTDVASISLIASVGLTFTASLAASVIPPPITMGLAAIAAGFGAYVKLHRADPHDGKTPDHSSAIFKVD